MIKSGKIACSAIYCLSLLIGTPRVFSQSPLSVSLVGEVPAPFLTVPQTVVQDALNRPYYYLAAKSGGLQVFDIQEVSTPVLVKTITQNQLSGLEVSDVFQRGNLLYLALGNFFGNNTQTPGLAILDVSTPLNPVLKDIWISTAAAKGSGFVTVEGDYAYLGGMADGFFILQVASPDTIQYVSQTIPDPDFPMENPTGAEVPRGRGMAVRGDLLFLCYDAGGLRILNIADKQHPVEVGRYINTGAAGKQQAFNNIVLADNLAYVAVDYCGLEILDVSNPAQISQVGWWNPWACESPDNVWVGSPGHTNQIAYDAAHGLVFLSSGQSELSIVDVSQPNLPQLAGSYGTVDNNIGSWGVTLEGSRIYLTYIVSIFPFASNWAGVKILEWRDNTQAEEPDALAARLTPNPFNRAFVLDFELNETASVRAALMDVVGNQVAVWPEQALPAGTHQLTWNGRIPPGIYTLQLQTAGNRWVKKLVSTGLR